MKINLIILLTTIFSTIVSALSNLCEIESYNKAITDINTNTIKMFFTLKTKENNCIINCFNKSNKLKSSLTTLDNDSKTKIVIYDINFKNENIDISCNIKTYNTINNSFVEQITFVDNLDIKELKKEFLDNIILKKRYTQELLTEYKASKEAANVNIDDNNNNNNNKNDNLSLNNDQIAKNKEEKLDKHDGLVNQADEELEEFRTRNNFFLITAVIIAYAYIVIKNIRIYLRNKAKSGYSFIPSEEENTTEMRNMYNTENEEN